MNLIVLFIKLILKGIRYRFYTLSGYAPPTEILSLELTRRCIAKCVMCNIWKTPSDTQECSISEWLELLSSPNLNKLKELDITGGEPFLRNDLDELLKGICNLKLTCLHELRSVAITTNGFLTEKILTVAEEIIPSMKEVGLDLILVFAMDGMGSVHDQIRNVNNGWQKLDASIQGSKKIREAYGNVIIGLKTTILPLNIDELDNIMEYAEKNNLFTIISPCIITENRYDNMDLSKELSFSQNDIVKIIKFYQGSRFKWSYHSNILLNFCMDKEIRKPCSAGLNYYFIKSTGDVFPCPLIKKGLGNFKSDSIQNLTNSSAARDFRKKIGTQSECRSCTEPGLERYALPFEGFHYLNQFFTLGKKDFMTLHEHMGLDKYV